MLLSEVGQLSREILFWSVPIAYSMIFYHVIHSFVLKNINAYARLKLISLLHSRLLGLIITSHGKCSAY